MDPASGAVVRIAAVAALLPLLALASGCDAGREISSTAAPFPAIAQDPVETTASKQWPGWRGTNCAGIAADQRLPVVFGPAQGLRWRADVPGEGNSSPVVWNDRVFLTSAVNVGSQQKLALHCFDRDTGKLRWRADCASSRGSTHVKNGYASATPVTDGRRVFVSFGPAGMYAFDFEGKQLWRTELGTLEHQWGTAASPVLFEDLVIQLCDAEQSSSIAAFRQSTGELVWRTARDSGGGWGTPVLVEATSAAGGSPRIELVANGTGTDPGIVIAYDPKDGRELWRVRGTTSIVCPTVIVAGGLVISTSGRNGPIIAIRPGGAGDVTESRVVWKRRRGGPYVPTGVAYRNRLYLVSDGGVLACYNQGDGTQVWQQRLKGAFTASLVAGGGQVYAVSERGEIHVVAAADEYRELAVNDFQQRMLATPAISGGELFIRGEEALYCVAAVASPAGNPRAKTAAPHGAGTTRAPASNKAAPVTATEPEPDSTDWPQWGGKPSRNMVSTNARELPTTWDVSAGKNVRWTAALGRVSYGNPALSGGKLFVGTNNEQPRDPDVGGDRGVLMCFRADDGTFLWQDTYEKLATGEAQDWPLQGICSSPAVSGERVYYLTNRAQVVCADTEGFADGENDGPFTAESSTGLQVADIVWRYDLIAQLKVSPHNMAASNPLIVGQQLFLVTSNGVDEDERVASPDAPSFVAFDKNTGKLLWQEGSLSGSNHRVRQTKILDGQWASPAYGEVQTDGGIEPQVYFPGGDGWLYALHPQTGELLWKFDVNPPESKWLSTGRGDRNYLVATPVFAENRVYIAVGQDPANGGGPGHLYAIDPRGRGDVTATHAVWHRGGKEFGRSISTVAVAEGLLFAAELDGFLHCLDAASGQEYWSHDVLSQVWGSPFVAGGHVYLGDEDGDVIVVKAARQKEIVAENSLNDAIYGSPIAAGRTLYITTRSEQVALKTAEQAP